MLLGKNQVKVFLIKSTKTVFLKRQIGQIKWLITYPKSQLKISLVLKKLFIYFYIWQGKLKMLKNIELVLVATIGPKVTILLEVYAHRHMRTHPPTTPHHTKPHEISPGRNQIRLILFQIIKYPHPLLDAQSCSQLLFFVLS